MEERILIEDTLKHLHECEYRGQSASPESLAGAMSYDLSTSATLLNHLLTSELVEAAQGIFSLTNKGREYARHVVRAHRLYETYLAQKTGVDETEWHRKAEIMEHTLSPEQMKSMAEELGYPRYDPHGDPIPTAAGDLPPVQGVPLLDCDEGWEGCIVHLEDEPPELYAPLVNAGLAPGMRIKIESMTSANLTLNVEGRRIQLDRTSGMNLRVAPFQGDESFDQSVIRLSDLSIDEAGSVVGLSPACRGAERNRLLDLGLVPGSPVQPVLSSAVGSPIAYLIRGAVIALRREQADRVMIHKAEQETA